MDWPVSQPGQSMRNLLRINDLEERSMKSKYLALGLSVVLALSLVSCVGQQAQEPQEPAQDIQQAEPVTPEPTVEPMEVKQEVKATDTQSAPVEGEQDTENEVDPAGTAGEAEPVVELFTEVNETVYATGTVNIRSSWSAESEKLGSLNAGQSITRTGVSISGTEAEGWSRVVLADNTVAYVSNKYLSTTKPVINSNNSSSTQQQQGQTQQGQNQQSTQQQPTQQTSKGSGPKALDPSMQAALDAEANKTWDTEHVNGDLSNLTEEQAKALGDADFRSWARLAGWSEEQIRHALGED